MKKRGEKTYFLHFNYTQTHTEGGRVNEWVWEGQIKIQVNRELLMREGKV